MSVYNYQFEIVLLMVKYVSQGINVSELSN